MCLRQNSVDFKIMGVINLTPDSFSDGKNVQDPSQALSQALKLIADGANLIDLGAESTRPGADPVDADLEWERLEPVLSLFRARNLLPQVTVDTRKPEIMARLLDWEIAGINDVSGALPSELLKKFYHLRPRHYIAMHMHGSPKDMQNAPLDAKTALDAVTDFFEKTHQRLLACGFARGHIWLDPGIGFGKTDQANLHLISNVGVWSQKYQVAVGVSRKSFIGRILDLPHPLDRDHPSKMVEMGLILSGARMIRSHKVAPLKSIFNVLNPG